MLVAKKEGECPFKEALAKGDFWVHKLWLANRQPCEEHFKQEDVVAFWSKKKPKEAPVRSWDLPGEIGTVELPDSLSVEMEDDQTLLAYPESNCVSLRFSSISFTKKGEDSGDTAKSYVCKTASEEQHPYYEIGDKGVLSFEEPSEHDGHQLLVKYWYVGSKSTMLVISASILSSKLADPDVKELLDLLPRIVESVAITKTHKIASYEGHEVPITEECVEPDQQKITPFGPSENAWLEENRQFAAALGVKYGGGGELVPEELDVIFSRWTYEDQDKEPGDSVANALGAAFGDYLVDQHGFCWVVVTDQYGTDYAVKHQIAETMAFPSSSVMKRIERDEPECFQDLRAAILDILQKQMGQSKSASQ